MFSSLHKLEDCPQTAASVVMEIMDSVVTKAPLGLQALLAFQVRTHSLHSNFNNSVRNRSQEQMQTLWVDLLGMHGNGKDKELARSWVH